MYINIFTQKNYKNNYTVSCYRILMLTNIFKAFIKSKTHKIVNKRKNLIQSYFLKCEIKLSNNQCIIYKNKK